MKRLSDTTISSVCAEPEFASISPPVTFSSACAGGPASGLLDDSVSPVIEKSRPKVVLMLSWLVFVVNVWVEALVAPRVAASSVIRTSKSARVVAADPVIRAAAAMPESVVTICG